MKMELKKHDVGFKDITDVCSRSMINNTKMEYVKKGSDIYALQEQWKQKLSFHMFMWLNIAPRDRAESAFQIVCDKSHCENTDAIHSSSSYNGIIPGILKLVQAILKELENASIGLWEFAEMVSCANM